MSETGELVYFKCALVIFVTQMTDDPYGGFLKWWYPKSSIFNRVFHYKTIHFGVPLFLETPVWLVNFWGDTVLSRIFFSKHLKKGRVERNDLLLFPWALGLHSFCWLNLSLGGKNLGVPIILCFPGLCEVTQMILDFRVFCKNFHTFLIL